MLVITVTHNISIQISKCACKKHGWLYFWGIITIPKSRKIQAVLIKFILVNPNNQLSFSFSRLMSFSQLHIIDWLDGRSCRFVFQIPLERWLQHFTSLRSNLTATNFLIDGFIGSLHVSFISHMLPYSKQKICKLVWKRVRPAIHVSQNTWKGSWNTENNMARYFTSLFSHFTPLFLLFGFRARVGICAKSERILWFIFSRH